MLRGLASGADGSLEDDTGHSWRRVSDWVEPADAERLVREGTRSAVQRCLAPPVAVRPERFRRDVKAHLITAAAAESYETTTTVPTVLVAELWRSTDAHGDLLLFIEQGPYTRSDGELQNDW